MMQWIPALTVPEPIVSSMWRKNVVDHIGSQILVVRFILLILLMASTWSSCPGNSPCDCNWLMNIIKNPGILDTIVIWTSNYVSSKWFILSCGVDLPLENEFSRVFICSFVSIMLLDTYQIVLLWIRLVNVSLLVIFALPFPTSWVVFFALLWSCAIKMTHVRERNTNVISRSVFVSMAICEESSWFTILSVVKVYTTYIIDHCLYQFKHSVLLHFCKWMYYWCVGTRVVQGDCTF